MNKVLSGNAPRLEKVLYSENRKNSEWLKLFEALATLAALGLMDSREINDYERKASKLRQWRRYEQRINLLLRGGTRT